MILFGPVRFIEVQLFELVDLIFQFLKRTAFIAPLTTRTRQRADLLIQVHSFIVLFNSWSVGADKVVELDDEMKSLTSDVNRLKGEPLQSPALPKDIASLNIARQ